MQVEAATNSPRAKWSQVIQCLTLTYPGDSRALLKRLVRGGPVPVVKSQGIRERRVCLTQPAVESDGLLGRRFRPRKGFSRRALVVIAKQVVAIRQADLGKRMRRILFERRAEEGDALTQTLPGAPSQAVAPAKVVLVDVDIFGLALFALLPRRLAAVRDPRNLML